MKLQRSPKKPAGGAQWANRPAPHRPAVPGGSSWSAIRERVAGLLCSLSGPPHSTPVPPVQRRSCRRTTRLGFVMRAQDARSCPNTKRSCLTCRRAGDTPGYRPAEPPPGSGTQRKTFRLTRVTRPPAVSPRQPETSTNGPASVRVPSCVPKTARQLFGLHSHSGLIQEWTPENPNRRLPSCKLQFWGVKQTTAPSRIYLVVRQTSRRIL
ncbi:hypothetical protein N658DRAFT_61033 [Parathielavia hyrcaniae]|uniref:Uncharacterized protein n=1 Tax=Parathielavia hyrcaniae TaxID=113614 RepID=A0AAN6Q0P5_9PEZI|nr:hypothetical protein N658DRAFT_61033 [Parathielavia hyrcaniae]